MQWSTRNGSAIAYALALCAAIGAGHIVSADTAVEFPNDPFTPVFPAAGTTFGWQFTVNETCKGRGPGDAKRKPPCAGGFIVCLRSKCAGSFKNFGASPTHEASRPSPGHFQRSGLCG